MSRMKGRRGRRGVFLTMVLYVAALTFLIVVLCAGVYYFSMRGYLKRQISDSNDTYLRQLSSSYELFLKNTLDSSMVFIESDGKNVMSLYGKSEDEFKKHMYHHLESISQMANFMDCIYFYDKNSGMVYLSAGLSYEISDFYDGAWLDSVNTGKDTWQILSARILEEPMGYEKNVIPIVIRYPFSSVDSPYLYVIHLRADELFQYLIKNVYSDHKLKFKVADSTGNIFISGDGSDNFKNLNDFTYLDTGKLLMDQNEGGSFLTENQGRRVMVHYTTSSQYRWLYISEMDYETVLKQLQEPLLFIIGVTVLVLAAGFSLCVLFSRKLYQPVKSLIDAVLPKGPEVTKGREKNEYDQIKEYYQNTFFENQSLQETVKQNFRVMMKHFYYNLLAKNYYSKEEIDLQLAGTEISSTGWFVVSVYVVDERHRYSRAFNREEQSLWEYAFENIACEIASNYGKVVFVSVDSSTFALILTSEEWRGSEESESAAATVAEKLIKALKEFIDFTFSAGIGLACKNIYTVNQSYVQAREALAYLEDGKEEIIRFRISQIEKPKMFYFYEDEEQLLEIIKNGEEQAATMFLRSMYHRFNEKNGERKQGTAYFSFLLVTALMKEGNKMGIPLDELFGEGRMVKLWESAVADKGNTLMLEELTCVIEELCRRISAIRTGVTNSQVLRITEYIRENYQKPITLGDIADFIGVNQSTVSRLMKQNLKMGTVDYINQVRIEKAIELIQKGGKKVSDISQETGFNNTHYFIRVFKKITGKTPGNMIEEMSSDIFNS